MTSRTCCAAAIWWPRWVTDDGILVDKSHLLREVVLFLLQSPFVVLEILFLLRHLAVVTGLGFEGISLGLQLCFLGDCVRLATGVLDDLAGQLLDLSDD